MVNNILVARSLVIVAIFFSLHLSAQKHFTPYDALPSMVKSHKPSYQEDMPTWAKMMYEPVVNYNEVLHEYNQYFTLHPKTKSPINRYFKQWCRALAPFASFDGTISIPDETQIESQLRSQIAQLSQKSLNTSRSNDTWTFWGPKETFWLNENGSAAAPDACPWQVNVYCVDVATSNTNVIFAGTETGFVNKSTDKGLNWQLMGQDYSFGGAVTAIAIHPENPDIVYAAGGRQVHQSTDGGLHWTPLLKGIFFGVDEIKIDKTNPSKILCGGADGLFLTLDSGLSWTKKYNGVVYDVEFKPGNNDVLLALIKVGSNFGLITSSDGGNTFAPSPSFPSVTDEAGGLLAVTEANPNLVMTVLLSSNGIPIIYKGTYSNGSYAWTQKVKGLTNQFLLDNGQGYYDLGFEISPTNENIVYVGTGSLYKSTNGATSFTAVGGYDGNFPIHPDIQDIKLLPNGDTWVVTDGGVNLTTDHFTTFSKYAARNNGLVGSDFWGFDQGWNEDIIVGGRYHNGNTSIADFYQPKALRMGGAESPTGWVLQGRSRHVAFNDLGNGWILPKEVDQQPEGRFLFTKFPNMEEYGGRRGNLIHHPNYSATLFLGEGNGFWQSTDMGQSWDLLHTFNGQVRYVQISNTKPSVLYADIDGRGFFKSEDGGNTWIQKPALSSTAVASSYWRGKTFFVISPFDENTVYACLQNGTWSADIGKVFKSTDGGNTWLDFTGSLNAYMKCMVIQPTKDGQDLVYLFTNATNGNDAKVYYRKSDMNDWLPYDLGYPSGMNVNHALPFFRDGKLRVAGGAGVWEAPLIEQDYTPIINPWADLQTVTCFNDTIHLDDHSIINHKDATWHWTIKPTPSWIESTDMRNPRVVLGAEGSYSVTMEITQNGKSYAKTINDMITAKKCPSIFDCSNPDLLPKKDWSLVYADSEETNYPGLASMAFDGDASTIWHTRWSTGDDPYPHELIFDMGSHYKLFSFVYQTRTDGENGRIKDYELYISDDGVEWGSPVKKDAFVNTAAPQAITLDDNAKGRYIRLVALSEVNGGPWASAAEFSIKGCIEDISAVKDFATQSINAYPMPVGNTVNLNLPLHGVFDATIYNLDGKLIQSVSGESLPQGTSIDTTPLAQGTYFMVIKFNKGITYRIKMVKS